MRKISLLSLLNLGAGCFLALLVLSCEESPERPKPRFKTGDLIQTKLDCKPGQVLYVYYYNKYDVLYRDDMGELEIVRVNEFELEPIKPISEK